MNQAREVAVLPIVVGVDRRARRCAPHVGRLARGGRGRNAAQLGFTLVELMIVVTIVGILAMMAVVGYRKLISSSHMSEATHMVNAIRVAQEAYRAESGTYLDLSAALAANGNNHSALYPTAPAGRSHPGSFKVGWGAACGSACSSGNDWRNLPVHADGAVMFGYSTRSNVAGTVPSTIVTTAITIGSAAFTWPASTSSDYFIVTAVGDTDGNGVYCTVLGSSFTPDLAVDRDGE